jgi:hypothetical protein
MEMEAVRRRSTTSRSSFIPALALLQSCGAGVVAVVASTDETGGGTTPALTAFAVPDPKVSPARIVLEANTGLEVEMEFSVPGRSDAMTLVPGPGISGNRAQLASGVNELAWDFKTDLGTSALTPDVTLRAKHGGAPVEGGVLALGMGNDPPEVVRVDPVTDPSGEALGNVEVVLEVSDTSADVVSLLVQWRRASDAPEDWKLATVGGVPAGVETNASGVSFSFFWKTESDALGSADDDFVLRVTADDLTVDEGVPVGIGRLESRSFRLDNNAVPTLQLLTELVVTNPDERRGIPVPFRVFDEEGDLVEVVLQWRWPDEDFPDLPTNQAALDAILADPAQRAAHHVCTAYPRFARGRALPVDATTIRLPELALGESWVLHAGLARRTLELLRPSAIPEPITPSWIQNPLVEPVALRALEVLQRLGGAAGRGRPDRSRARGAGRERVAPLRDRARHGPARPCGGRERRWDAEHDGLRARGERRARGLRPRRPLAHRARGARERRGH